MIFYIQNKDKPNTTIRQENSKTMNRKQLENKYGITIVKDYYYNPFKLKFDYEYIMYSADNCKWENGLRTIKAVENECRKWEPELLSIKRYAEARGLRCLHN